MTQTFPRVFKPRLFMRLAGWGLIFGFGGALAALLVYVALHYSQMPTDDLWSAFGIGVFLLLLALLGVLAPRSHFLPDADYIEVVRP